MSPFLYSFGEGVSHNTPPLFVYWRVIQNPTTEGKIAQGVYALIARQTILSIHIFQGAPGSFMSWKFPSSSSRTSTLSLEPVISASLSQEMSAVLSIHISVDFPEITKAANMSPAIVIGMAMESMSSSASPPTMANIRPTAVITSVAGHPRLRLGSHAISPAARIMGLKSPVEARAKHSRLAPFFFAAALLFSLIKLPIPTINSSILYTSKFKHLSPGVSRASSGTTTFDVVVNVMALSIIQATASEFNTSGISQSRIWRAS